jgi:hypothetical protein
MHQQVADESDRFHVSRRCSPVLADALGLAKAALCSCVRDRVNGGAGARYEQPRPHHSVGEDLAVLVVLTLPDETLAGLIPRKPRAPLTLLSSAGYR